LFFFSSSGGGQLIFVDTSDMSIMLKQEHPDLSDVEWDPTGRYVTSSVNLWNAKVYLKNFIFYIISLFWLISVIIHLKFGRFKAI
jgi:hypothetical protein